MHEIELAGLDGGNLLGFLAAAGALRVVTMATPGAQPAMRWVEKVRWIPVLIHSSLCTPADLAVLLSAALTPPEGWTGAERREGLSNANVAFGEDYLDGTRADFRRLALEAAAERDGRKTADFFAGLGNDCFAETRGGETPATTDFRAVGAGNNEGFLGFMRTIHLGTTKENLRKALFEEWDYSDGPPVMRWDPNEYRPHALRATDPAKDRKQNNVRGANRLAIEAMPLFPVAPDARQVRTVGFEDRERGLEITWPIWEEALGLPAVKSLLALGDIQRDRLEAGDGAALRRRGIAQVFRARRFTEGKYRNFSPARALL